MKLAVSGTYSSGKTLTVMTLAHYTGIPRTLAATIRELMPLAVPGKTLSQVTPAEYLQIAMRRHVGRAVAESQFPGGFISDGSSLQEWIYAVARQMYGMDPSSTAHLGQVRETDLTPEMRFFGAVVDQYGHAFKQHVKAAFDGYVHLANELPLAADGHRPMNSGFRDTCDTMLLETLDELRIPYHVISGSLPDRLRQIVELHDFPVVTDIDRAISLGRAEYALIDMRLESQRQQAVA